MKAQEFLELVGRMMTAQEKYYASRKTASKKEQLELLVASKQIEKQVKAVIKEGALEPDEPTQAEYLKLELDEHDLDLFSTLRPTDEQGENKQ